MTAGLRALWTLQGRRRIRAKAIDAAVKNAGRSNQARARVNAYAITFKEPPREIQLWDAGPNPTDYGVHVWTPRSAEMVMGRYLERGNPLQIDVDHNYSGEEVPVDGTLPTGGYAALELRAGVPWLVFDWSAYGVEQITTGQRLFLSPEYDVDKKTGEILALYRVSLVGDPATHNARQLARRVLASTGKDSTMASALTMMLAALSAANSHEDPEVAKANVKALVDEYSKAAAPQGGEKPAPDGASDPEDNETLGSSKAGVETPPDKPTPQGEAAGADATGGGVDNEPDEDDEKKKARRAATAKKLAGAGATAPVLALAQSVAGELIERDQTIAELKAKDAARDKREKELEASERVAAAGEKIPEALRGFAKGLSKADFDVFVKGLPEPKPGTQTQKRVNAAARPASGHGPDGPTRPEGELDPEDKRVMARVFRLEHAPEKPVTILSDGRLRLTCLARPKPAPQQVGGAK